MPDSEKQAFIGLMSGTSLDGIDAVLVEFKSSSDFILLETHFTTYSDALRHKINQAAQNNHALHRNEDSPLHAELALVYTQVCEELIKKSGFKKANIQGIANHGQTVKHEPSAVPPYSLQLGDGQLIANQTGLTVYTQFRQGDLAVGGQGAPLMPAFHADWLTKSLADNKDIFVLNIGGIANISKLGKPTLGFDTGPGNVLLDQWTEKHLNQPFDKNGEWASKGKVNTTLLARFLQDPYFALSHPKSTGTDYFNLDFLYRCEPQLDEFQPADVQATLVALTVSSIATEIENLSPHGAVYVCGGGARNMALLNLLKERLSSFEVDISDELGVPSDWVEAVGFAWLGYCCENKLISNMPSVTGATKEVVLGQVFKPGFNK